jgi:hypothetical protein
MSWCKLLTSFNKLHQINKELSKYPQLLSVGPLLLSEDFTSFLVSPGCIRQNTGAQNIVKEIKQYQKKWLQHVQRMDTNRLPKQALQYKLKGRRNIGRPRKRWRDQLHLGDQGTGNTPNPSGTWWWWSCIMQRQSQYRQPQQSALRCFIGESVHPSEQKRTDKIYWNDFYIVSFTSPNPCSLV